MIAGEYRRSPEERCPHCGSLKISKSEWREDLRYCSECAQTFRVVPPDPKTANCFKCGAVCAVRSLGVQAEVMKGREAFECKTFRVEP